MNVHKRCEKNVANNCGINTKDMAAVLNQLGISGDKLNPSRRKTVRVICNCFCMILVLILMLAIFKFFNSCSNFFKKVTAAILKILNVLNFKCSLQCSYAFGWATGRASSL